MYSSSLFYIIHDQLTIIIIIIIIIEIMNRMELKFSLEDQRVIFDMHFNFELFNIRK